MVSLDVPTAAPPAKLPACDAREAAATAAAELVEPGMTIGLGSGRAVWAVVDRLPGGTRAVVASELTRERALTAGIEVIELDGTFELDLALDGADEVDASLGLIKGGGGALLREKIVISAARRFVVVAETAKKVERLGEGFRLPVEVVRFGWRDTRRRLSHLLPDSELRTEGGSEPYVTDEGHYILDAAIPPEPTPPPSRTPSCTYPASWNTASSSTWPTWPSWAARTAP